MLTVSNIEITLENDPNENSVCSERVTDDKQMWFIPKYNNILLNHDNRHERLSTKSVSRVWLKTSHSNRNQKRIINGKTTNGKRKYCEMEWMPSTKKKQTNYRERRFSITTKSKRIFSRFRVVYLHIIIGFRGKHENVTVTYNIRRVVVQSIWLLYRYCEPERSARRVVRYTEWEKIVVQRYFWILYVINLIWKLWNDLRNYIVTYARRFTAIISRAKRAK